MRIYFGMASVLAAAAAMYKHAEAGTHSSLKDFSAIDIDGNKVDLGSLM